MYVPRSVSGTRSDTMISDRLRIPPLPIPCMAIQIDPLGGEYHCQQSRVLTSSRNEHGHTLRCAAYRAPYEEETNCRKHDRVPPKSVGEAAGQGQDRRAGETIRGTYPYEFIAAVQRLGDRGESGSDSGEVKSAAECADENGGEGQPERRAFPKADTRRWASCGWNSDQIDRRRNTLGVGLRFG